MVTLAYLYAHVSDSLVEFNETIIHGDLKAVCIAFVPKAHEPTWM